MRQRAIKRFFNNIEKLLGGHEVDLYESLIDAHFEYIAAEILSSQLERGIWFDGTNDLRYQLVDHDTVSFFGTMMVMQDAKYWTEPFSSRVTRTRGSEIAMQIYVRVGEYEGAKNLFEIKWEYKNA